MSRFEPQAACENVSPGRLHRHWLPLAASALLLVAQISPWCYPMPDGYQYLSMARSVAHGHGLAARADPHGSPPKQPGYSILISPLFLIADRPFWELSIVQFLLAVVFMAGVYVWARQVVPAAAIWIAALSVANGAFWIVYRQPLSDVAFACGCVWSINLLYAAIQARPAGVCLVSSLAAAAMLSATCAVRSLGITFALGCCLALLLGAWRGRLPWRRAVVLTLLLGMAAAATVAALIAREYAIALHNGAQTYAGLFKASAAGLTSTYPRGLQLYIGGVGRDMIPAMLKSYGPEGKWLNVNMLVYIPFFALLLLGWARWIRRQADPFAWTLPLYMAVLVAYSGEYGVRYCVPLLPALWVCLWFALEPLQERRFRILATLWGLHVAAALGYWLAIDLPWAHKLNRQWPLVDRLVARVGADPGPIAVASGPVVTNPSVFDFAQLVQLALDRPVADNFDDPATRDRTQWLITPGDRPPPPAFVPSCPLGPYQLLHRGGGR